MSKELDYIVDLLRDINSRTGLILDSDTLVDLLRRDYRPPQRDLTEAEIIDATFDIAPSAYGAVAYDPAVADAVLRAAGVRPPRDSDANS